MFSEINNNDRNLSEVLPDKEEALKDKAAEIAKMEVSAQHV